jgi:probable F420-dependent oxidoreductase
VKFAISLGMLNPRVWPDVTQEAERLGYDSVWLPEHLVFPVQTEGSPFHGADHPPVPADVPVFDAFTYLGFLAGRTERIRFSTHVYNIGLRHPFVSARAVATLDMVSGGRVEFGIGASWLRAEWDAVGLDFDSRGRRVDESIAVCRRLWTESVIEHRGEFFVFGPVMFEPKPVQTPYPPLVIGGDGPAALRRAASVGDGWVPMNHTLEQIPPQAARLAELRAAAGRDGRVEITLGATPTDLDDVVRYADAGVGRVIVRPWQRSRDAIEGLRRYADEVVHPAATALAS